MQLQAGPLLRICNLPPRFTLPARWVNGGASKRCWRWRIWHTQGDRSPRPQTATSSRLRCKPPGTRQAASRTNSLNSIGRPTSREPSGRPYEGRMPIVSAVPRCGDAHGRRRRLHSRHGALPRGPNGLPGLEGLVRARPVLIWGRTMARGSCVLRPHYFAQRSGTRLDRELRLGGHS